MNKTVKQSCGFNPVTQDYRVSQGIEGLTEKQGMLKILQLNR